jgi:hypothetical protein
MKKLKPHMLLLFVLALLIATYGAVVYFDKSKQDNYQLTANFYLNKIDYFSKYSILKICNNDNTTIVVDIEAISILSDTYLVKFKEKSTLKYLYLYPSSDEYIIADNLNDLDELIQHQNVIWRKPWQIVEMKTLSNPVKLVSQILLMLVIILGLYITMRIFNLKRITKSP